MLHETISFLQSIGLPTMVGTVPESSFLPNIFIRHGTIQVTSGVLIGDLLHEAGHLAVVPSRFRPLMHGALYRSFDQIFEQLANLEPTHPDVIAMLHAEDTAATAWSWACGVHLGVAHDDIITTEAFDGDGAGIRSMLSRHQYIGIHALQGSGFCAAHGLCNPKLPVFPRLAFWAKA